MEEIWKDIEGYEGLYQVSNLGRVRSLKRNTTNGIIRKQFKNNEGYMTVTLSKNGIIRRVAIHRLVAKAFIPNPHNLPQVNHRDENPEMNCVENLEWCDSTYNNNYGSHRSKVSKSRRKMVCQYDLDSNLIKVYDSPLTASKETNICYSSITGACNGRPHTAGGYIWKYAEGEAA